MHDQPDHEGQFLQAIEEQTRTKNCNLDIVNIRWKIDESWGSNAVLAWSVDTNEELQSKPKSKRCPKGCIYGGTEGNFVAPWRRGPKTTLTRFPHTYGL